MATKSWQVLIFIGVVFSQEKESKGGNKKGKGKEHFLSVLLQPVPKSQGSESKSDFHSVNVLA
jgi:hypothetical protein